MSKKLFKKIAAISAIGVIVFSPFLLILDFKKYTPFVLTVWLLSAVYFVFVKERL